MLYRAFCRSFFLFAVLMLLAVGRVLLVRVVGAALVAFAVALAVGFGARAVFVDLHGVSLLSCLCRCGRD